MQTICNIDKFSGNVCANEPGGIHDGGQFKMFNVYRQLKNREILQELVVVVRGVRCTPYIVGDATYPI
jgi:hypothetical protein